MKYNVLREFILKTTKLTEALNLLVEDDSELRRHLESLLLTEWEDGYKVGFKHAKEQENFGF